MRIRTILAVVMVTVMFVGCGKVDERNSSKAVEKKDEIAHVDEVESVLEEVSGKEDEGTEEELATEVVAETTEEIVPTEQTQPEEVQKTEQKTEQKKIQTKAEAPAVTTPVVSENVVATPEPEVNKETCEHWYQPVFEEYTYTREMVWGCNGCGYPLFTIEDGKPVHFSDMYVHPPCETDRFEEPCVGGGFHSEIFTSAKCAKCRGSVILRDCMFSVMGLRCIKNEILGPYEKVEEEHVRAYIKSCDCGENFVTSGANGNGLLFVTETCCYCGDVINYPQK